MIEMPNWWRANPLYEPYQGGDSSAAAAAAAAAGGAGEAYAATSAYEPPQQQQQVHSSSSREGGGEGGEGPFYSYISASSSDPPSSPAPSAIFGHHEDLGSSYHQHRASVAPELPPPRMSVLSASAPSATSTAATSMNHPPSTYYDADPTPLVLRGGDATGPLYCDIEAASEELPPPSSHYTMPRSASEPAAPPVPQRPLLATTSLPHPTTPGASATTTATLTATSTSPNANATGNRRVNVGRGSLPAITPADSSFEDDDPNDGLHCTAAENEAGANHRHRHRRHSAATPPWFHPGNISREQAETLLKRAQRLKPTPPTSGGAGAGAGTAAAAGTVWLVRSKKEEETYVLSVLRPALRPAHRAVVSSRPPADSTASSNNPPPAACEHYLLSRSVRADGSRGAHWIVNRVVRLVMCRTINEIVKVLQKCLFTSKRVYSTVDNNATNGVAGGNYYDHGGPLLTPQGYVRVPASKVDANNTYDMAPPGQRSATANVKSSRSLASQQSFGQTPPKVVHVKMECIYDNTDGFVPTSAASGYNATVSG